jgi:hypothetical protein
VDHHQAASLGHSQLDGPAYYQKTGLVLTIVYTQIKPKHSDYIGLRLIMGFKAGPSNSGQRRFKINKTLQ